MQHILIRTVTHNADGTTTPFSEEEKGRCYEEALRVREEAVSGEAFESLIEKYSDASESTLSFGKGEQEAALRRRLSTWERMKSAAWWKPQKDMRSSSASAPLTGRKRTAIRKKSRNRGGMRVFGQEYDAFVDSLPRNLNEPLWESVSMIRDEEVNTDSFFRIYQEHFHPEEQERLETLDQGGNEVKPSSGGFRILSSCFR